jgi:poly(A) polymerase
VSRSFIIKAFLAKLFFKKKKLAHQKIDPNSIVPRAQHSLSRRNISDNALKVLYRLKSAGFQAYIVGGGVRDLLLDLKPKDFDIVTDAHPEQVKNLFSNCRLIGRRFRLAHVHFGRDIIEVATFRGSDSDGSSHQLHDSGIIKRDNTYGTLEEDIWRRDITINALYYNIANFSIVDTVGGISDIQHKIIRVIGDPEVRYREDPVRMLRVVRLAAKLDFTIEKTSVAPIKKMASMLESMSNARLFEEVYKLFHTGAALKTFHLLLQQHLFQVLFPQTTAIMKKDTKIQRFIECACRNTDSRIRADKKVTPAFLFAVLLWYVYKERAHDLAENMTKAQANALAISQVLAEQVKMTSIPKMLAMTIRDIWHLQFRLTKAVNQKTFEVLQHPKFRAAYDFLLLRAEIEPEYKEKAAWWTRLQEVDPVMQTQMLTEEMKKNPKARIKRRPNKS